ncbi:MAG TPA: hypothetical protein VKN99_11210 [Polyangia bacterium]|nr:hypothetical protein [Polyangia bacterium]
MAPPRLSSVRARLGIALAALFAGAACGGQSCSCLKPIPGGFDPNRRVPNAVQARVGSKGITYLEQHVQDLITAFVPGGLNQAVPPSCSGSTKICCENPDPMCVANVNVTSLALNPTPPSDVGLNVRAIVRSSSHGGTSNSFPVQASVIFTVNCDVSIDTTRSGAQDLGIVGTVTLQSPADAVTDLTSAVVNVQDIVDLDDGDINISGGLGCAIANIFKGLFIGTLKDQLKSKVQDAINQQLCQRCQSGADCAPFTNTCSGGSCMLNGKCVQQIGAQGRLDAGNLLSKLAPGLQAFLDLYMVAGHYADTNNGGISLGILGGMQPATHNSCVPMADAAMPQPLPMSPTFDGNVNPNNNQQFDVAIGLHKWFLEHGGWAAWQAGVLCLSLSSATSDLLNSGTFSLLAPSMGDLTHGLTEPLIIAVRPAQSPQMTLGRGTITTDAMGNKVIQDPLVTVTLPDFTMDFYLMSDDRYIRLFTMVADASLPLALDVDGQGKLVPILGDVTGAFRNIRVSNSQLLSETTADLAMKFPTVLAVALPFIAKSLPPIALPSIMGIKLKVSAGGITSTDNNTMLAIFADLQTGMPLQVVVETSAQVEALEVPPTEGFRIGADFNYATQMPAVHLRLGGGGAGVDAGRLEWQYRIDEGFWSVFQTKSDLTVRDPILMWQGHHVIEVRARVQGQPDTLDPGGVRLPLLIDTVPPQASAEVVGRQVRVTAHDMVTPDSALRYSYARAGGAFVAMDGPVLTVAAGSLDDLTIRVTDEAGNHGYVFFHGREMTTSGCNCSLGGRGGERAPTGALFLMLAGAAVLCGRRRRGGAGALWGLAVAVAAAALVTGCGADITGGGANPDSGPRVAVPGATGRWSDLGASSGHVLVSAYEEHYGDLLVGTVDPGGKIQYQIVDGVPNSPPTLDPSGYRGGITDPGDDVGLYTSLKLDAMGRARVSYFDATHGALKLALARDASNAAWDIVTVDAPPLGTTPATADTPGVRVGIYTSLTLDKNGLPQIAYMAHGLPDGMGSFQAELRFARPRTASPAAATDFTIQKVDQLAIGCKGLCAGNQVCTAMPQKCVATATGCSPGCGTTQGCVSGASGPSCVDIIAAPKAYDLPEGVGLFAHAARLANDDPLIVYHDRTNGNLKLAQFTSTDMMWHLSLLDGQDAMGMDIGDVGQWCSVAVGAGDTIHIAYQDAIVDTLRYLQIAPGGGAPVKELADDGVRADGTHSVGDDTQIMVDAGGNVRIVYQDGRAVAMQMAQRTGPATWTHMDLPSPMSALGHGFFPKLVADGATLWASDFYYDRNVRPFGQLEVKQVR